MAAVYILYSQSMDKYYIGSCVDFDERLEDHIAKVFKKSFTAKANDWIVYYTIDELDYKQARRIEKHIKEMKSRKYLENLKLYPEISEKLKEKYFNKND